MHQETALLGGAGFDVAHHGNYLLKKKKIGQTQMHVDKHSEDKGI